MTKVATIAADVNKKRVLCRVSMDILDHKFGVEDDEPLHIIAMHRPILQEAAKRLIENEIFETDGSIVIRANDLEQVI